MNTDKLVKAIQILVKEELKLALPKLVKETVKSEMIALLKENKELKQRLSSSPSTPTFMDMDVNENNNLNVGNKTYTKNPILNKVLNETAQAYAGAPTEVSSNTLSFNTSNTLMGGGMAPDLRAQMAAKMGYESFGTQPRTGLGVQTGNEALDNAFNRDYSELVKRFKK